MRASPRARAAQHIVLLSIVALAAACIPHGSGGSPAMVPAPSLAESVALEHDILRWTNVERLAAGLPAFTWNDRLARVARAHSEEMARLDYFAHESPVAARKTVMMRAKLAGLDGPRLFVGENLAKGNWCARSRGAGAARGAGVDRGNNALDCDDRARRIVDGWMKSPGHRANILRRDFEHLGVGVAWDGTFVLATQVFSATP